MSEFSFKFAQFGTFTLGLIGTSAKNCLFRKISSHHRRLTNADGLSSFEKNFSRRQDLQKHCRQNLSLVKTVENRLNKEKCAFLANHLSIFMNMSSHFEKIFYLTKVCFVYI